MLAVSVFATGNEGVNPPQSGVLTSSNGVAGITNTFAFPFQTVPLLVVYAANTNGTPITNALITTTNFGITFPINGSTNNSFAWQAFVGGTKMAFGSVVSGGGTNVSVTFPFAYATPPVVTASGNSTNTTGIASVTAITITNFTILSQTAATNSWISVGTVYNPQSEYTGQFPVNNKVLSQ